MTKKEKWVEKSNQNKFWIFKNISVKIFYILEYFYKFIKISNFRISKIFIIHEFIKTNSQTYLKFLLREMISKWFLREIHYIPELNAFQSLTLNAISISIFIFQFEQGNSLIFKHLWRIYLQGETTHCEVLSVCLQT